MSIVKIASFGYEIFVMLSSTQSIYNVHSYDTLRAWLRKFKVLSISFMAHFDSL